MIFRNQLPVLAYFALIAAPVAAQGMLFGVTAVDAQGGGITVDAVAADSPAATAGIKKGDRIISIDSADMKNLDAFAAAFDGKKPGDVVNVVVRRDGADAASEPMKITLGERKETPVRVSVRNDHTVRRAPGAAAGTSAPEPEKKASREAKRDKVKKEGMAGQAWTDVAQGEADEPTGFLGVTTNPDDEERLHILQITPGSGADRAGIKVNDILLSIDGEDVSSIDELHEQIQKHKPGDTIVVKVTREGTDREVHAILGKRPPASMTFAPSGAGGAMAAPATPPVVVPRAVAAAEESALLRGELTRMRAEMQQLRKEIDDLQSMLRELTDALHKREKK